MMKLLGLILVASAQVIQCAGTVFYVSPEGTPSGDGTMQNPWDLATALQNNNDSSSKNSSVKAGDTILLRGGVYYGGFSSQLMGSMTLPIEVKPFPNERPIIEARAANTTGLYVNGPWVHFWGLEVWNSSVDRWVTRNPGLMVFGSGTKLINLVVHDAGVGIGCWEQATNSEVYGCLIYNNGYEYAITGEAKAHGIYSHSSLPGHRFRENMIFNGFGFGIHCYSEMGEPLAGFQIEGNVCFNNGILNTNPAYLNCPNYLVGGYGSFSNTPVQDLTFLNNFGYYTAGSGAHLQLGYSYTTNRNCLVQSNYFGNGTVDIRRWTNMVITDNTFAGLTTTFRYSPGPVLNHNVCNSNQYFSVFSTPFLLDGTNFLTFTDWKSATGFDKDSQLYKLRPTDTRVFLRTNAYEAGRANVIVYNWGLSNTVQVDLSRALAQGSYYELRNAQDFFAPPVVCGKYMGTPVQLPMTNLSVAKPVGCGAPNATGPEFNAFILISRTNALGSPLELEVIR